MFRRSRPPAAVVPTFSIPGDDGNYRVKKERRDLVVFAPHNLLADPPFTKLDLLSCRNLLIYLEPRAQRQLFPLFQYALKRRGLLFLGSSESIGEVEEELFATLEKKWKLYQRKPWDVVRRICSSQCHRE